MTLYIRCRGRVWEGAKSKESSDTRGCGQRYPLTAPYEEAPNIQLDNNVLMATCDVNWRDEDDTRLEPPKVVDTLVASTLDRQMEWSLETELHSPALYVFLPLSNTCGLGVGVFWDVGTRVAGRGRSRGWIRTPSSSAEDRRPFLATTVPNFWIRRDELSQWSGLHTSGSGNGFAKFSVGPDKTWSRLWNPGGMISNPVADRLSKGVRVIAKFSQAKLVIAPITPAAYYCGVMWRASAILVLLV